MVEYFAKMLANESKHTELHKYVINNMVNWLNQIYKTTKKIKTDLEVFANIYLGTSVTLNNQVRYYTLKEERF